MTLEEKDELLLAQLVLMFQTAAWQQMGKLKNPATDTIHRDMAQAQISIDMIDMLHRKMAQGLSPDEERMFTGILSELRLNYVDEASKSGADPHPSSDSGKAGS